MYLSLNFPSMITSYDIIVHLSKLRYITINQTSDIIHMFSH